MPPQHNTADQTLVCIVGLCKLTSQVCSRYTDACRYKRTPHSPCWWLLPADQTQGPRTQPPSPWRLVRPAPRHKVRHQVLVALLQSIPDRPNNWFLVPIILYNHFHKWTLGKNCKKSLKNKNCLRSDRQRRNIQSNDRNHHATVPPPASSR